MASKECDPSIGGLVNFLLFCLQVGLYDEPRRESEDVLSGFIKASTGSVMGIKAVD